MNVKSVYVKYKEVWYHVFRLSISITCSKSIALSLLRFEQITIKKSLKQKKAEYQLCEYEKQNIQSR